MNTKLASPECLSVIDQYLHFRYAGATISIPYYNNNHKIVRAGLRGTIGKGSPRDIFDEIEIAMAREKVSAGTVVGGSFVPGVMDGDALKRFLVDHDIGIDCSGFVFYVMNAEYVARRKGSLDRHLKFPYSKGLLGVIRARMRPAENADVATFAHGKNSNLVMTKDTKPGDIVTMIGNPEDKERDHILFIHGIDYQNFQPTVIHYTHSMAWPSDGNYGHGVRQGTIEILDPDRPITEQKWTEARKTDAENYTLARALKARTEIRRMVSLTA